ncbi:LytTR family DNA-binding domain-containing protein [Azospirillum sp. sgz302134]
MLSLIREAQVQPGAGQTPIAYRRRALRKRLPVLLATIAVLTVLGPFGTFEALPLPQRLAYWGGLIGFGFLAFELLMHASVRLLKERASAWRPMLAGVGLTVTVLETAIVALLERSLRDRDFLHPLGIAELFVYVAVITALVSAVPLWLELRDLGLLSPPSPAPVPEPAPEPAPEAPREPAFLARIPARLGRDLLALEMEDHYVRVHTAEGSDLILMRLRDAIAELSGLDGLQVHRSHWVAASAVTGVERKPDGKLTLILRNGLRVPVSRSYAAEVRAKGWVEKAGV